MSGKASVRKRFRMATSGEAQRRRTTGKTRRKKRDFGASRRVASGVVALRPITRITAECTNSQADVFVWSGGGGDGQGRDRVGEGEWGEMERVGEGLTDSLSIIHTRWGTEKF